MSQIAQQVINPTIVDRKEVAETYCNGPINLNIMGPCGTLTFSTVRADAAQALAGSQVTNHTALVSARVTLPLDVLVALKGLLNQMLPESPVEAPGSFRKQ